jgi:subtilase family serine protease
LVCRLSNTGADLKGSFTVSFFVDGTSVGAHQIDGLAAGKSSEAAVANTAQAAGRHRFSCALDRENVVSEVSKSNNAGEVAFIVATSFVAQRVPAIARAETPSISFGKVSVNKPGEVSRATGIQLGNMAAAKLSQLRSQAVPKRR